MMDTVTDVIDELDRLGTESGRKHYVKFGATGPMSGVKKGDLRKLAKAMKSGTDFALELWATGHVDAQLLAVLLMKPKDLTADQLDAVVRQTCFVHAADWLSMYVTKKHPAKASLRERWMTDADPWAQRAGWSLTAQRVEKSPEGLDLAELLDRIEAEMGGADERVQWTMNVCLAAIGIHDAASRDRAVAIGEALGVYRDYPTSKGCTSPFAPEWIGEMVRRQQS